ncbi:MAG: 16S rRNA (guanine(527)-N(7))-methyltransferase RsmG [Clostridia bacterium]|nr:16S rRNA (guanine(527)-N(7))-methyltransferase RsmG [Clostridia bacterium]
MNAMELAARLTACGIPFDDALPEKLLRYHALLMDWNTRMDLTAVTDEDEMIDRHYVDSLMALKEPGLIPAEGKVIDVGTGAGFPGMPLALACPQLQVTLMDAQQKRLTFLQAVIDELGVKNVTLIHRRAEDGARDAQLREQFDVAVARAVAPLAVLAEYLLPFVKVGGKALCWKGPALQDELTQGRRAAFLLGGQAGEPIPCEFPGREWQHQLLPIQKVAKTARQYPRKAGTPSKSPLGQSAKNAEM